MLTFVAGLDIKKDILQFLISKQKVTHYLLHCYL
jgi:hypothetical protein